MLRDHVRTLFSPWHLAGLAAVGAVALAWPAGNPYDQYLLRWFLGRTEVFGPLALMALTNSLFSVDGQIDERWGAAPRGLGAIFTCRWLLMVLYYALALGLVLVLAGPRAGGTLAEARVFASALVTSALFSLPGPLVHHATGSAPAGWAAGLVAYFGAMTVAMFWCPADSTYQLWLPFAGISDAGPLALALSKAAYGLGAAALLWANVRQLRIPERLLGRAE